MANKTILNNQIRWFSLLICGWALWLSFSVEAAEQAIQLVKADRHYTVDQTTPPPADSPDWTAMELKDIWRTDDRQYHLEAWYRLPFTLTEQPDQSWAIFLQRVSSIGVFYLNGVEVGSSAQLTDPLPNAWNYPVLLEIPEGTLKVGDNELMIHLMVQESVLGYLFEPLIGPLSELQPSYKFSYFAKVTAAQILTGILLAVAVTLAVLIVLTPQPSSYFWFMSGTFLWVIYSLHLFWLYQPLPQRWWHALYGLAELGSVICYIFAVNRLLNRKNLIADVIVAMPFLIAVVAFIERPTYRFSNIHGFIVASCVLLLTYFGLVMCRYGWFRGDNKRHWLALCGLGIISVIWYDMYMLFSQTTAYFAKYPFIPLVALVIGGATFLVRYAKTYSENSLLKNNLVHQQSATKNAVEAERERLMREIHDGVGGQLVSALSVLEKNDSDNHSLVSSLKTSLHDLRLIISSLETMGQEGNIVSLLATMRERMEGQLNEQGIRLEWAVESLPALENFGPAESLQLMRVVQEAVTNVIKHSNASIIRISCGCENGSIDGVSQSGVVVQITNNGSTRHLNGGKSKGYGLTNMRHRAETLCGHFKFTLLQQGASVRVWIPLDRPTRELNEEDKLLLSMAAEVS